MSGQTTMPTDAALAAAMVTAVRHLETAVKEQEYAVGRILGLVELLLENDPDRVARARLEGILEECAFQDITGQRITKVNRFLRHLAKTQHIAIPQDTTASDKAGTSSGEDVAPAGLSQAEVDRLLRGEHL